MRRDKQAQSKIRERLIELRSARGLTQAEIGDALGYDRFWYMRRENGQLHLSAADLAMLEKFFEETLL